VSEIREDWLNSAFVADTEFKQAMVNAGALATAQTLQKIIRAIEAIVEPILEETGEK